MKFRYEYRTSDNVKHDGIVNAADKDAAFAVLRSQGIRPSRMAEAPGFFNKLFGKGKRWIAICALAVALIILLLSYLFTLREFRASQDFQHAQTRRQVIGDVAIIEKGIRTGWSDVFGCEGERFLASFAVPGVPAGVRNVSEDDLMRALTLPMGSQESDGIEARQIRAMVEGMKSELRRYLSRGGSVVAFGARLVERQEEELRYYSMAKNEIENAMKSGLDADAIEALLESKNAKLRKMGIRPISLSNVE